MNFRSFGPDEIIFSIQDFQRVTHSEQKTKAFCTLFDLYTSCENVANSIFEILASEPARHDENRPSYDFPNMTQLNF